MGEILISKVEILGIAYGTLHILCLKTAKSIKKKLRKEIGKVVEMTGMCNNVKP